MMEAKRIADEIELTDEAEENLGRSQNEAIPMDQQVPRAPCPKPYDKPNWEEIQKNRTVASWLPGY